jgi:hypothetical protein
MTQDDHGSASTYRNYGCRCTACRTAHVAYQRAYWGRRRASGRDVPRSVSISHLSDAQRREVLAFVRLLEKDV